MEKKSLQRLKSATNNLALMGFVAATSTTAFAEKNFGESVDSVTEQIKSVGNLAVVVMFVIGLFCLYKIVQTVMNREDERQYPLKNIPLYFLGAAVGIGSSMSSDLVQNTIFGETNQEIKGDFFKVE